MAAVTVTAAIQDGPHAHPTISTTYAAHTNQGFLLREVGEVAALLVAGLGTEEILRQVRDDDLFQLRTAKSRQTIGSAVVARLTGVPDRLLEFLAEGSSDLRRLTNLYLILLQHRLLREFLGEVVDEARSRLATVVTAAEMNAFLERKREQVPDVAGWSEQTLQKSRSNMLNVCVAAGLLVPHDRRTFSIQPQWVPGALRYELRSAQRAQFLRLLLSAETT